MKKLKAFAYVYSKSLTSISYYKDVLKTSVQFSVKYYLMLVLFASLLITTTETILVVPEIKEKVGSFAENARQTYPQDLVIKFENGKWEINRDQPFVVPMPKIPNENVPENLIVFYEEGTVSDVDLFDTVALVNNVNLIIRSANGIQARSLESIPNTEINRQVFDGFIDFIFEFTKVLPYVVFIAAFVGLLMYFIFFRLTYGLAIAGIIYFLSLLNKKPLDYVSSFKIGLHSMTAPITLQVILSLTRLDLGFPLWFFILNIFFAMMVIFRNEEPSLKKKK